MRIKTTYLERAFYALERGDTSPQNRVGGSVLNSCHDGGSQTHNQKASRAKSGGDAPRVCIQDAEETRDAHQEIIRADMG